MLPIEASSSASLPPWIRNVLIAGQRYEIKVQDERTRRLMLDELDYDIAHNQLHISPLLSGQGQRDYPNLLREAILEGSDATLAQNLRLHRRLIRTQPRRTPKGGFTLASTPENAAEMIAEGQFNRYYIRALSRRAIEDGIPELVVYRAKRVLHPRPERVRAACPLAGHEVRPAHQ